RIMQLAGVALLAAHSGTFWYPGADAAELYQPLSVQQSGYTYDSLDYYLAEDAAAPSPSDTRTPQSDAYPGYGCSPAASCRQSEEAACCYGPIGRALFCCDPRCPWTLPQTHYMRCHGITAGGWLSAGVLANSRGNIDNGPLGFNDRAEFNMHQLWFYLNKETNTDELGWDWGGRIDYVFGVDGPDTQAFGDRDWDFGWNSSAAGGVPLYGSAIPQMYATLAWDDWTLKAGRFFTIIGYETVQATGNFFYSHSYAQYYAEPFTHTGLLLSRELGDWLTVHAGWTNGWDSGWRDLDTASMFLGGISAQLTDRASLTWAVSTGRFGNGTINNDGELYMNSIVFEWNITRRLTYVLQHDLGINYALAGGDTEWYGINQYFLYQINPCWASGLRFEWFRDHDGVRVANSAGVTGFDGNFYAITAGLNWKPRPNLTVRPELRYDWFDGTAAPFNSGNNKDQFSGGFDVIATF
ncbi:MAG: porin, partial [Thermoguttaceae bacterium]|nr:porin [Thermoguttaceae bacterium]